MLSNKPILITLALIASLFSNAINPKKIYFIDNDSLVELNGNVKQLISARVDDNPNLGQDFDTVNFDKQGNVTKIITGFHGVVSTEYYRTKYSYSGHKIETIGYYKPNDAFIPHPLKPKPTDTSWKDILTYRYDENGYITQYFLEGNKKQQDSIIYKYNLQGYMVESDYYFSPKLLERVIKYIYDSKGHLIEENELRGSSITSKKTYKYISLDWHNNWTDMIIHSEISLKGYTIHDITIHRKITYY